MTKVEELRERLIQAIGTYGVAEDKGMPSELCETLDSLIAAAKEDESAKIVHCGECVYAAWESQEPYGTGEGIACHVIAGRSRPWLGAVTDYCSEGRRKVTP